MPEAACSRPRKAPEAQASGASGASGACLGFCVASLMYMGEVIMTKDDNSALAAASDAIRRANDLTDVADAIAAASRLMVEALQEIERDLLKIASLIDGPER
jgi:hypothetical protein